MPVDVISGITGAVSGSSSTRGKDELGQDAFLKLMIAQLKNQDPTKPADPTEFLGQLAQFSTVSGIQNMRDSITSLSDSLRGSQVLGGTALVGHAVLAVGDAAVLDDINSVYGTTTIPPGASEATLLVTDSTGQQVARVPLAIEPGSTDFTWDGTDGFGERLPPGRYKVTAIANVGGSAQQLETQLASFVHSVSIDPNSYLLTLNTEIGPIALSAVRQVI